MNGLVVEGLVIGMLASWNMEHEDGFTIYTFLGDIYNGTFI
jgi:hypothetical protein